MVGDTGTGFGVARPQHNLAQLEDEVVSLQDEESMVNPTWMATMPKFNSPPDISKFMAIGGLCRNSSTSQG
jgi:hypothetical protein